ncbi:hypothetical protein H0H93_002981 [Arthromyces matolae]|nr:hypothetical protein H0H93_002981 [Arthromyces matolae]
MANQPIVQDVTNGQQGIALTLDIGILDVTTCQPLPNVMVEIWSANALGNYGSFLRGASPAGSNGIVEFQTIFPGYTSSGANHINVMVHTTSSLSSGLSHVGQVFFTDKWTTIIGMQPPYNNNTNTRIFDLDDPVYQAANNAGFYPVVELCASNALTPFSTVKVRLLDSGMECQSTKNEHQYFYGSAKQSIAVGSVIYVTARARASLRIIRNPLPVSYGDACRIEYMETSLHVSVDPKIAPYYGILRHLSVLQYAYRIAGAPLKMA